jgi:hypothetical protein
MKHSAKYPLLLSALLIAQVAAQEVPKADDPKTEAPKSREFLWGDKPADAGELPPVFDGKTLNGWLPRGQGIFRVENGEIVGETGQGGHGWLTTDRAYGDFVMELELKNEGGNSGIQIRSHINEKDVMVGYQIEVDPTSTAVDPKARAWSGGLYEQGRRAWLQNVADHDAGKRAFKVGDWNHYRIEAIGDRIRSWVNGVPISDYVDAMDIEGVIALQIHSGKGVKMRWRNLKIKDLGTRRWLPLWDGKTLNGWHPIGKGEWKIENGAIVGRHSKEEKEYGHLVSDRSLRDFTVRLKYKAVAGNSGFYFRSEEKGFSGISGIQAEIDPKQDAGGLYDTNGRSWIVKPGAEQFAQWVKNGHFKKDEWNILTVSAHGDRIVVNLNGHQTAQIKDEKGRREGIFALQVHGGQDVEVHFKDIEVLGEAEK